MVRGQYAGWNGRHALALATGLVHFVVGFGLQLYGRNGLPGAFLIPMAYAVSALGLVLTGALPVLLWVRYRLVLPGVGAVSWFLWGLNGTWTMRRSLPRGAFQGINWNSLPPYPDYMLKWNLLLIAILVLAGAEFLVRRGGRATRDGGTSALE